MANVWDADVDLPPEGARRLIERQFPALSPASLEPFGKGWDNDAYLVNGAYVFRFPRRAIAAEILGYEVRALPALHGRLPLPVPDVRFVGAPDDGYPYPFAGYPVLAGHGADRFPLDDAARATLAEPLGAFLRALHGTPLPEGLPADLIGRADLPSRVRQLADRLALLDEDPAPGVRASDVLARATELARARPSEGVRLVHGDLYARHLLLDDDGRPCGVIDWGDVHAGDPALDLSVAYAMLPPAARPALFAAYGDVDEDTHARARFRALHSGVMLVHYGRSVDDGPLAQAGEDAVRFALS